MRELSFLKINCEIGIIPNNKKTVRIYSELIKVSPCEHQDIPSLN